MSSLRNLYRLLSPLEMYALGQGSLIDKELESYGAAFALLEEQLARLEGDIRPQTAGPDALALHEGTVGLPPRPGADLESRRALILARLQRPPMPNGEGVPELAARAGFLSSSLLEEEGALYLSVSGVAENLSPGAAWALLLAALPAHLQVLPHPAGKRWVDLDGKNQTWNALDNAAQSWDTREILTPA